MNIVVNVNRFLALKNAQSAVSMVGGAVETVGEYTYQTVPQASLDDVLLTQPSDFFQVTDPDILAAFASLGPNLYYFSNNPNNVYGTYGIPGT